MRGPIMIDWAWTPSRPPDRELRVPSSRSLDYRLTALPPYRLTALPPYRLTALPPYRLTALPPYRLTALPPYRLTALPPYRLTAFAHPRRPIRQQRKQQGILSAEPDESLPVRGHLKCPNHPAEWWIGKHHSGRGHCQAGTELNRHRHDRAVGNPVIQLASVGSPEGKLAASIRHPSCYPTRNSADVHLRTAGLIRHIREPAPIR